MPPMDDPFDLRRFITAQDAVYADVLAELKKAQEDTLDVVCLPTGGRAWQQLDRKVLRHSVTGGSGSLFHTSCTWRSPY